MRATGQRLGIGKPHEHAPVFIPQMQTHRLQAGPRRERLDLLEDRVFIVAALELVVGDAWAEMMDVVEADIAADPLKQPGELVVRRALHRRCSEIPVLVMLPVGFLKLMLHIEQPDAGHR